MVANCALDSTYQRQYTTLQFLGMCGATTFKVAFRANSHHVLWDPLLVVVLVVAPAICRQTARHLHIAIIVARGRYGLWDTSDQIRRRALGGLLLCPPCGEQTFGSIAVNVQFTRQLTICHSLSISQYLFDQELVQVLRHGVLDDGAPWIFDKDRQPMTIGNAVALFRVQSHVIARLLGSFASTYPSSGLRTGSDSIHNTVGTARPTLTQDHLRLTSHDGRLRLGSQ